MTTPDQPRTLLSVRAQAQRVVPPDAAHIQTTVSATAADKGDAASEAFAALAAVTADLADLGGQVLTADTTRSPLTWSASGLQTRPDYEHHGKQPILRGQLASIDLQIVIRDFGSLADLESVVTRHEPMDVHSVQWLVDDDNPSWRLVRADAITAALIKGQDYAAALGGTVQSVEHVADAGLLGESNGREPRFAMQMERASGGHSEEPTLTPVPQTLSAVIDARLTATRGPLPSR